MVYVWDVSVCVRWVEYVISQETGSFFTYGLFCLRHFNVLRSHAVFMYECLRCRFIFNYSDVVYTDISNFFSIMFRRLFYFFASFTQNIMKRGFLYRSSPPCSKSKWFVFVCVTDKLFGQCRSSRHDQVQYQVSVPVLQRLQEVLKELMRQGNTHTPHTHMVSWWGLSNCLLLFLYWTNNIF